MSVKKKSRTKPMAIMSIRMRNADRKKFVAGCKRHALSQSEVFRRMAAALAGSVKAQRSATINLRG